MSEESFKNFVSRIKGMSLHASSTDHNGVLWAEREIATLQATIAKYEDLEKGLGDIVMGHTFPCAMERASKGKEKCHCGYEAVKQARAVLTQEHKT